MSPSARNLVLANAATLAGALYFDWNVGWLLWPYWMQSVVIGWYARKRMLSLHRFSTEGFTSNEVAQTFGFRGGVVAPRGTRRG